MQYGAAYKKATIHGHLAKGSKWLAEAAKRNNAIDYVD